MDLGRHARDVLVILAARFGAGMSSEILKSIVQRSESRTGFGNHMYEELECTPANGAWPYFGPDEIEAAMRVLKSGKVNYWIGEECRSFERAFAAYTRCSHAVALSNGTVALELALRILRVQSGDEVVTTPRAFIAPAGCAALLGARPVMADIDSESQNITAESIENVLTPRTRAIISVHLSGWPCDMDSISELAHSKGIAVIEDCAQAHGATYKGKPVGSLGDAGAFSFSQEKIISTAGEGGMLTVHSKELFEDAWAFKEHGKCYDAVFRRQHPFGFRWLHESFGTNLRMTEIQAAIGCVQLHKLDGWVEERQLRASIYNQMLRDVPGLRLTIPPKHIKHSYYKYDLFVEPDCLKSGWSRNRIVYELNARGVDCTVGGCGEIYLQKAFPDEWRPKKRLPVAKALGETSIMFKVHPTLPLDRARQNAEVLSCLMREAVL
jgi:dTDP-4-amino-4,6-dideoxygalactose transaminase